MKQGKIHIGTSGWSYSEWKGGFYPKEVKSGDWLTHYARYFNCAEINSSFYRLPRPSTVAGWAVKVPEDFRFCPKMSRYLTHIKRLREPEEPLSRFFGVFDTIRQQCGPVLLQLPPSLKFDADIAQHLFAVLTDVYRDYQFVLEGRHHSWLEPEATELLMRFNVGFVVSQSGVGFPYGEHVTSSVVYLRFHGPDTLFYSRYSDEMMYEYSQKIKKWRKAGHDVWVFFNNTAGPHALDNARLLKDYLKMK